jgi:hypothetical protein
VLANARLSSAAAPRRVSMHLRPAFASPRPHSRSPGATRHACAGGFATCAGRQSQIDVAPIRACSTRTGGAGASPASFSPRRREGEEEALLVAWREQPLPRPLLVVVRAIAAFRCGRGGSLRQA